jgi:hypothetical protein
MLITEYSILDKSGASTLSYVENVHSYLLAVKTSIPVIIALAEPCLPVLAVEKLTTLHGLPLIMTRSPFFNELAETFSIPAESALPYSKA